MISNRTSGTEAREALYDMLGRGLETGLPVLQALEMASRHLPTGEREALSRAVTGGSPLAEALGERPWVPSAEGRALEVAERAGHLDGALRTLGVELHEQRLQLQEARRKVAYPLLVLHLAPAALHAPLLLSTPLGFVLRVGLWIGTGWGLVLGAWLAHRRLRTRAGYQGALDRLPLLGSLRRQRRQRDFLRDLGWLYAAGVAFPEAVKLATGDDGTGDDPVDAVRQAAARGEEMGACLQRLRDLPAALRAELAQAAEVGHLEDSLSRVNAFLAEEVRRRRQALLSGMTTAIYALAIAAVAWTAMSFYGAYFGLLGG